MIQGNQDLYTIILEFEGTTSISQRKAKDPYQALNQWFSGLADTNAYGLTPMQIKALDAKRCPESGEIVPLSGVQSVWCTSALINDSLALFNIVKTD